MTINVDDTLQGAADNPHPETRQVDLPHPKIFCDTATSQDQIFTYPRTLEEVMRHIQDPADDYYEHPDEQPDDLGMHDDDDDDHQPDAVPGGRWTTIVIIVVMALVMICTVFSLTAGLVALVSNRH